MQERPCRTYADDLSIDSIAHDRHYTVAELAERWHLSPNTIRRLVEDEPGVLKYGLTNKKRKRRLVQLRIPERVALRVHAKLSN
jgi:hypothetical protein